MIVFFKYQPNYDYCFFNLVEKPREDTADVSTSQA